MILVLSNKTPPSTLQAGMKCWRWGGLSCLWRGACGQPDGGGQDGGGFDGLIKLRQRPDLKTVFMSVIKMKILLISASNSGVLREGSFSSASSYNLSKLDHNG